MSALRTLAQADNALVFSAGAYRRCASPPARPPAQVGTLRRLTILSGAREACLQWFAVDVFVDATDEIAAVTIDLWEP